MKEFFDTSVLISAFWSGHPQHQAGLARVSAANKKRSACAAHTLAEVYATMTVLPVKDVIPPEQVLLFVQIQEVGDRFTIITLAEDDYFEIIDRAAARGFTSGASMMLCFLQCAAKAKAEAIYTWNLQAILPSRLTESGPPDPAPAATLRLRPPRESGHCLQHNRRGGQMTHCLPDSRRCHSSRQLRETELWNATAIGNFVVGAERPTPRR